MNLGCQWNRSWSESRGKQHVALKLQTGCDVLQSPSEAEPDLEMNSDSDWQLSAAPQPLSHHGQRLTTKQFFINKTWPSPNSICVAFHEWNGWASFPTNLFSWIDSQRVWNPLNQYTISSQRCFINIKSESSLVTSLFRAALF